MSSTLREIIPSFSIERSEEAKILWLIPESARLISLNLCGRCKRLRRIRSFHLLPTNSIAVEAGHSGRSLRLIIMKNYTASLKFHIQVTKKCVLAEN